MQWLINIIKAWIIKQGYLTSSFIDRGDPDSPDFSANGFVKDGNWHDLDLSSIVPKGAKAVTLTVLIVVTETTKALRFRKKGNLNVPNISQMWNLVANLPYTADLIVACNSNRVIEYLVDPSTWTDIEITVKGWWL